MGTPVGHIRRNDRTTRSGSVSFPRIELIMRLLTAELKRSGTMSSVARLAVHAIGALTWPEEGDRTGVSGGRGLRKSPFRVVRIKLALQCSVARLGVN